MNLFVILVAAAGIANLIVGSYVLLLNPRAKLNRLYFLFAWTMFIWNVGDLLILLAGTPTRALLMDAVSTVGSVFTVVFLLHYFLIFAKKSLVSSRLFVLLLYLPAVFFAAIAALGSGLITVSAEMTAWGYRLLPGSLYLPLAIYVDAYFFLCIAVCWHFYYKTKVLDEKSQAKILTLAVGIAVLVGNVIDVVLPSINGYRFPPLASAISTLLAVSVAYVIKRYGLMAITPGMAATKIIETMNESLVVLDCQGNISFVNAATQALFGRSEAELAGRPLQDVSSPLLQLFDELKGKDSLKEYEVQISDQSGQAVQVSVNASIMRGRGGEATGAVLVLRDISEFKKQMVIIEEQRQRLTTILQSIGDGVFVVDASRKIVLTNRRALHLAGEEEDGDMVGRPFIEVFRFVTGRSQEKADDFLTDALTGQAVTYAPLKTDLIRKDGERLPVAVSAAPLLGANGVLGGVAVIRDERREREVEELKNEFVSITSHQLRTPLTAIRWLVEDLLGDGSGNLTPEQKESLNNTLLSDLRMLALIKDLLNVSRLESGRVAVIPAVKDIDQLCAEAIAEVQPLAAAKQIEMKNQANGLGTLNIDARLVFQALANLLNNAIKYSQSGGTVIVSGARREDGVLIAIKDNGLGIPKRQQSLIFRKFFRADNAATSDAEGNGLGLFVAKSIIESSGGRIWFESVEDQGSTFYVSLPLAGSRAQPGDRGLEKSNF